MEKKTVDIEKITHRVEQVVQNRLIIAILLIVDGVVFLMNPGKTVEEMGRAIAISMALAAAAMVITRIAAKERFVRFLPVLILLAAAGLMYFFPAFLSGCFRIILALLIIINGIVNLFNILGVNYSQGVFGTVEGTVRTAASKVKRSKELEEGIQEQTKKYLRPIHQIVSETKGHKTVFIVTNILSVILGVLMLAKPDLSISIFGAIFIYVGFSDFLLAFRAKKIAEKLRDKKFREILFDETNEQGNQTEENSEVADQQT